MHLPGVIVIFSNLSQKNLTLGECIDIDNVYLRLTNMNLESETEEMREVNSLHLFRL